MSTAVERVENQINNQVDPVQFIIDKRIPLKLLQVDNGQNVIYCKKFKEDLFDSGIFSTREKDFVHNYITENDQKYIVTDVSDSEGKTYKNVKFKIVVNEKAETPYSTFSPNNATIINEKVVLAEDKIVKNLEILEKTKQNDFEKKRIEEAEQRLENKKNRLINEENQLLNKKLLLKEEKEKAIQEQKQKEKEIQEKYKIIKEAKDDIIASSRQYLEEKIKASSEDNKNYARRILELGGGGGSVAVQYANGGTMNGDLIVNGTVAATGGNSNQWNSVYSTVKSLSDSWEESIYITPLQAASASWDSVYTSVNNTSSSWNSVYNSVSNTSASWDSTYTTLSTNSANWNSVYNSVSNTSANWDSVYSTTNTNSSYWSEAYTNLVNNSATYLQGGGGGPENVYTLSSFETTLSASQYSIFVKTVTGENVFTYNNFVSGRTITVYLSSNHSGVVGHYFPVGTYFAKNGNSNLLYSFSGCVTRANIQNIGDSYQATTEVIPYNVSQYVKAGDYLLMETGMSFLSQQDDSRILLE